MNALLEIREVSKSDSLFILPDDIKAVLDNIDNKTEIIFDRKFCP